MPQSPATPLPSPKERRRLREAKSLSQADLAARIGVTRETVRSWETGRTQPRGRKLQAYAKLLNALAEPTTSTTPAEPPVASKPSVSSKPSLSSKPSELSRPSDPSRPSKSRPRDTAPDKAPANAPDRTADSAPEKVAVGSGCATRSAGTTLLERDREPAPTAAAKRPAKAAPAPTPVPVPKPVPAAVPQSIDPADLTPAQAFDALCADCAPGLVRQAYALTGRRDLAQESVERAFQQAWQRWPEVAVDRDPAGWVRAAAYEYAMSPWHRLRLGRRSDAPPATPADRAFLKVLMDLPPVQRRALLLYDGVGLDLPETAAETEASTPATAHRLMNARETVGERLPDLADPETLHRRLDEIGRGERLRLPKAERIRTGGEHRTRFWTRTAIAFTTLIVGATGLTLQHAPTRYEAPLAPGRAISGVPPRMGPGPFTPADQALRNKLHTELTSGPYRLTPRTE
ncbi:helix-turn-helix domain-containing protein [Streptomyces sp. NPDC048518]|uniref:helix-turn-helix domain-containing protein n=1 Tax=Streptomyces sp. NPDC048518 TaxID=3155029 RepID=UPI0033F05DD0